jgi:hypothetical protein
MSGCRAGKRMPQGGADDCAARLVRVLRFGLGVARPMMAAQADFYVHDAVCALSRRNPRQGCWVHYSYFQLLIVHCNSEFRIWFFPSPLRRTVR